MFVVLFTHLLLSPVAHADLQSIHDRREDAMISAQMAHTTANEDAGYQRECEKTTNTKDEYEACIARINAHIVRKANERAAQKAAETAANESLSPRERNQAPDLEVCERDAVIKTCDDFFISAQKDFTAGNIQSCRRNCLSSAYWITKKIYGCSSLTQKTTKAKLDEKYKFCETPAPNEILGVQSGDTNLQRAYETQAALAASGQIDMHIASVKSPVISSMNTDTTNCIQSNTDPSAPPLCAHVTSAIGGYKSEEYYYSDRFGNKFNNQEAAATSNSQASGTSNVFNGAFFGSASTLSGSTAEAYDPGGLKDSEAALLRYNNDPALVAPIPLPRPTAITPSTVAGGGGGGQTTSSPTAAHNNDPLTQQQTASVQQQQQPAEQNDQTGGGTTGSSSGGGSSGGGGTNGGGSSFGDAAMFPGLQSAKSSPSSSDATNSISAVGNNFRVNNPSGSSGYKSYSGGANGLRPGAYTGNSSEVAGGGNRSYAKGGVGVGAGGGSGMLPASNTQGLQVASNSMGEKSQPNIPIGDQGFYKPGGSALQGGNGGYQGFAKGKGKKPRVKSVGGCAPGNVQCVLASIGTAKGKRVRVSNTNQSRLPAGVTSGVEDIFSRIVHFHNYNITLDHEGMIDNGDGGFD